MIEILVKVALFIFLRAKKIILLSIPISIVLGIVCSIIPGAATVIFIVLKVKGLLSLAWGWIAVPIILDLIEIGDLIAHVMSD